MDPISDNAYALFSNPDFVSVLDECSAQLEKNSGEVQFSGELIGDVGAEAIVSGIIGDDRCKELNLEMNEIGDHGCVAIAKLLLENKSLECLNLNNNQIGPRGARRIAEVLSVSECKLKVLEFEQNDFKTIGAREIAVSLQKNESLEILCLNWNRIKSAGKIFAKSLRVNTTLRILSLGYCEIDDATFCTFGLALAVNKTLEELSLPWNRVGDVGAAAMAIAIGCNNTLQVLNLFGNAISDTGGETLLKSLDGNKSLKQLILVENEISEPLMNRIENRMMRNYSYTKSVKDGRGGIGGIRSTYSHHEKNDDITESDIASRTASFLSYQSFTGEPKYGRPRNSSYHFYPGKYGSLEKVYEQQIMERKYTGEAEWETASFASKSTTKSNASTASAKSRASHNSYKSGKTYNSEATSEFKLRKYTGESKDFNNSSFVTIETKATAKRKSIVDDPLTFSAEDERVDLHGRKLGELALSFSFIGSNCREIDLELNEVGDKECIQIGKLLGRNKKLERLNLKNNLIGKKGAQHLAKCLKKNTSLRVLQLQQNELGPEGVTEIANALRLNNALEGLFLDWNTVNKNVTQSLGASLRRNATLRILHMGYCDINDESTMALAQMLEVNESLTELSLPWNNIGNKGAKNLAESLKKNKALISLVLSGNSITNKGGHSFNLAFGPGANQTLLDLELDGNEVTEQVLTKIQKNLIKNANKKKPTASDLMQM